MSRSSFYLQKQHVAKNNLCDIATLVFERLLDRSSGWGYGGIVLCPPNWFNLRSKDWRSPVILPLQDAGGVESENNSEQLRPQTCHPDQSLESWERDHSNVYEYELIRTRPKHQI